MLPTHPTSPLSPSFWCDVKAHSPESHLSPALVGESPLDDSTQMATTAVNGATVNDANASSAPLAGSRRQQSKGAFGNKSSDGNRRQADNNGGENQQRYDAALTAFTALQKPHPTSPHPHLQPTPTALAESDIPIHLSRSTL